MAVSDSDAGQAHVLKEGIAVMRVQATGGFSRRHGT
jgi:hypothetical protein